MPKELEEIRSQIIAAQESITKIKANGLEVEEDEKYNSLVNNFSYYVDSLWRYVSSLEQEIYSYMRVHQQGHLPPIKTASDMANALNILGIGDDYEVYKPTITVAKRGKDVEITATYKKR